MNEAGGEFGTQLRARRRTSGLSQEDQAERSGLNVRTIRNLECGHVRWPYRDTLHRLADALDLRDAERADFVTAPGRRLTSGEGAADPVMPPPGGGAGVPRQLPAGVRHFTGRKAELDFLTALLDEPGGTVVISAISGTAGAGKSALAVHWAHQHAGHFPDGQLYADLRGFDSADPPVKAAAVMRCFLDALAVPPARIPVDPDAQTGLYRSMLAGRRMLILLDNARDAGQVRPLLPGAAECVILITSRSQLTDLIALEGATLLTVGLLSTEEAHELLGLRLGTGRVASERPAADELIGLCGHLPLALNITAARAAANPLLPLGTLATRLRNTHQRLEVLSAGTGRADVRAVFSGSYHALSVPAARLFRLLAAHPGPDFSLAAVGSLAALDLIQTRRVLEELTGAHLVTEHVAGRYTLPDLLREHAAELHMACDGPQERRAAVRRVLDHYLHNGNAAAALYPNLFGLPPPALAAPAASMTRENMTVPAHAVAWFAAEHRVLIAAATRAADGFDTHAMRLPLLLRPYLCSTGGWPASVTAGLLALAAARRLGDMAGQGHAHCHLGSAYRSLGNLPEAESHLQQALIVFRRIDHPQGQGITHTELQVLCRHQQRNTDALYHAGQALTQYRIAGWQQAEANGLNSVGWCHVVLGEPAHGLLSLEKAIALLNEIGDRLGLAYTLDSMGYAYHRLGEHEDAINCYGNAQSLAFELGVRPLQAVILDHLGDAHRSTANTGAARCAWQQALDIYTGLDHHDITGLRVKLAAS
jgi:tetratricopeptide (TPR) repeat protein